MTPTPRTDAAVARMQFSNAPHDLDGKFADFARELECENARMRETLAKIKTAVEPKKCFDDIAPFWGWIVEREIECLCNSALSPAIPDPKP